MKKLFFASLWALACLAAACSNEKDKPNDESGSIVGEWVFQRNEYYRNGKLVDSFTAVEEEDKAIAIFREDGTYRYYDFPPEEYYDGTYSYDEMSGVLTTDDGVNEQTCLTEITVSTMKWIYDEGARRILFTEVIGRRNSRLSGREHRPDFFTDKHFLCTEQSLPISGKSGERSFLFRPNVYLYSRISEITTK